MGLLLTKRASSRCIEMHPTLCVLRTANEQATTTLGPRCECRYNIGMNLRPTVRVAATPEALAIAAAELFVAEAKRAPGVFKVAFSGGSTPKRMFQILAERFRED